MEEKLDIGNITTDEQGGLAEPEHHVDTISSPAELSNSKRAALMTLLGLTIIFAVSVFYSPTDPPRIILCGFKNFTGLPCPGCGLTHSFCALGKAHILSAFRFNLVGPPFFLFLVMLWIRSLGVLTGRVRQAYAFDDWCFRWRVPQVFLLILLLYGAGRIIYVCFNEAASFYSSPLYVLVERLTR